MRTEGRLVMERMSRLGEEDDRAFDREFWGACGEQAIWDAAWEQVELWWVDYQGRDLDELRFQRSVGGLQRTRS